MNWVLIRVVLDLVVASAGDDKKISLWRKNGQALGTIPAAGSDSGDSIEVIFVALFLFLPFRFWIIGNHVNMHCANVFSHHIFANFVSITVRIPLWHCDKDALLWSFLNF